MRITTKPKLTTADTISRAIEGEYDMGSKIGDLIATFVIIMSIPLLVLLPFWLAGYVRLW